MSEINELKEQLAAVQAERDRLREQMDAAVDQRCIGHGEGQEHAIADVNTGRIDDLIWPRLAPLVKRAEQAESRLAAVRALVEEMKAALQPFAAMVHEDGVEAPYPEEEWVPRLDAAKRAFDNAARLDRQEG